MRFAAILGIVGACASAWSAPGVLSYQAKLTDSGGHPITTTATLIFSFWDAESGGNILGNSFSDLVMVAPDANGIVSTLVGDDPGVGVPVSIFASPSVWLNVNVNGADIVPRERVSSVGYALNALPLYGSAYTVVVTANDPVTNGSNLLEAYDRAKTLTPNGQPLSATNRSVVLIPPGKYDLGAAAVLLDTNYVDIIGVSNSRADQYILGTANGPNTGVIQQTADDVHIENLSVQCTTATGTLLHNASDSAAYFPEPNLPNAVMVNCEFHEVYNVCRCMRTDIEYSGTYSHCLADEGGFGAIGIASGTFTDCSGGDYGFGGGNTASGVFTNCVAGYAGFGSTSVIGTFTNCTAGNQSFGGGYHETVANGTFINCVGGTPSFGGSSSGVFIRCVGGDNSFGGVNNGIAGGTYTDCDAGNQSFGGANPGHAIGTFKNCRGGSNSFGGGVSGDADNGKFYHCDGGPNSFTETGITTAPVQLFCTKNGAQYSGNN